MKSQYKDILNGLVEMQASPVYAARKGLLISAELALFSLEKKLNECEAKKPDCAWEPDDDYYHTACGNAFKINDGGPKENHMRYCVYCGGKLVTPNV